MAAVTTYGPSPRVTTLALARVLATLAFFGCRPDAHPPVTQDAPTNAPLSTAPAHTTGTAAGVEFASPEHGYRLTRPADWSPVPSPNYVLQLVPPAAAAQDARPVVGISVDVPDLPPHVPGFIPLGLVVNGYVGDLKEQYADVKVEESNATRLAGANARRVRSRWTSGGREFVEDAVLTVHGDRVYIFRLTAHAADYPASTPTFEALLQSVGWVER